MLCSSLNYLKKRLYNECHNVDFYGKNMIYEQETNLSHYPLNRGKLLTKDCSEKLIADITSEISSTIARPENSHGFDYPTFNCIVISLRYIDTVFAAHMHL